MMQTHTDTLDDFKPVKMSDITQLTATRCCVCGKSLTDAESVEHGIGPTCSRRYYDPLHKPTEYQVQSALGWIAISNMPDHIITSFTKIVNNRHADARLGCNLMVYWASCNYHDETVVLKCAQVIRDLGYIALADKLETDRTAVTITVDENDSSYYRVGVVYNWQMIREFRNIPGAVDLDKRQGRTKKHQWNIPVDKRSHLSLILGVFLGGQLACGTKVDGSTGVWTIPRRPWAELKEFNRPKDDKPSPPANIPPQVRYKPEMMVREKEKLYITTPYHGAFIRSLKTLPIHDRKWNMAKKQWEVKAKHKQFVKKIILDHFRVIV